MSFYVKRVRSSDGRVGWVGPIRSPRQAAREKAAWEDAGFTAEVHASSGPVRREVQEWRAWLLLAGKQNGRTS